MLTHDRNQKSPNTSWPESSLNQAERKIALDAAINRQETGASLPNTCGLEEEFSLDQATKFIEAEMAAAKFFGQSAILTSDGFSKPDFIVSGIGIDVKCSREDELRATVIYKAGDHKNLLNRATGIRYICFAQKVDGTQVTFRIYGFWNLKEHEKYRDCMTKKRYSPNQDEVYAIPLRYLIPVEDFAAKFNINLRSNAAAKHQISCTFEPALLS